MTNGDTEARTAQDHLVPTSGGRIAALARYLWEPVALAAALLLIVAAVWISGDKVIERAATDGLIHVVLVVGLYIFISNSGVLAFGNMAFMMIGAYAVAWFTMSPFKKSFALNLPDFLADTTLPLLPSAIMAATLAAIVAGVLAVPLMRLSGIAASIGTFAALMVLVHALFQLGFVDLWCRHPRGRADLCRHVGRIGVGRGRPVGRDDPSKITLRTCAQSVP